MKDVKHPDADALNAFLSGGDTLADTERGALEAHLDECAECRMVVAEFLRTHSPSEGPSNSGPPLILRPGTGVGRYVIQRLIGAGGIGVVYSATDPVLNREVAIKLLRPNTQPNSAEDEAAGVLREARTLAQLSHPNILAVHDAGTFHGQVFVALEFVSGGDLRGWLSQQPRTWEERLDVLMKAGAGLAAAHATGTMHRDVKPENILVGSDGRVRLSDFGMALVDGGTPRYMAPEQRRGLPCDARSDQFSFCVTATEMLGSAPLPHPRPLRQILRTLQRGQAENPSDRFRSMEELLRALSTPLQRKRWIVGTTVGAAAVIAGTTLVLAQLPTWRCSEGRSRVQKTWNPTREHQIARSFQASGAPFAPDVASTVGRTLEGYSARWAESHQQACEASARAEQTEHVLALKMDCLERRLSELEARIRSFEHADAQTVELAIQSLATLTPLSRCADTRALLQPDAAPTDAAHLELLRAGQASLLRAQALFDVGQLQEAQKEGESALTLASQSGHAPLVAETNFRQARFLKEKERGKSSDTLLLRAIWAAERGHAHEWRIRAWLERARLQTQWQQPAEANQSIEHARAALASFLSQHKDLEAEVELQHAVVELRQSKPSEALERLSTAEELAHSQAPDTAWARIFEIDLTGTRASAFRQLGMFDNAVDAQRTVLRLREEWLGANHPSVATSFYNLATALGELGRWRESERAARSALERSERLYGLRHPIVAVASIAVGRTRWKQRDFDEGERLIRRGIAIETSAMPPNPVALGRALGELAELQLARGELAECEANLKRIRSLWTGVLPENDGVFALLELGFGWVKLRQGFLEPALVHFERSVQLSQSGGVKKFLMPALYSKGVALLHRGESIQAGRVFEQVLLESERQPTTPTQRASVLFRLGVSQWRSGHRETAQQSVEKALATLEGAGPSANPVRREIETWLQGAPERRGSVPLPTHFG